MFAKTSIKRKSDKCQVPENGLHEKEQNMAELAIMQDSVVKEAIETADSELKVKKKVKLSGGDPEAETLVFIIIFCSFSKCMKYLICGRLNAFCLHKLNWQAVSSLQNLV
jgi:hypothetical protein